MGVPFFGIENSTEDSFDYKEDALYKSNSEDVLKTKTQKSLNRSCGAFLFMIETPQNKSLRQSMFETFQKKSFHERLKDTGFLLKNSFKVVGMNFDIVKPTVRMAVFSAVMIILIFFSVFTFLLQEYVGVGIGVLLFTLIILVPYRFFYNMRQKANQSWMTYTTIIGRPVSYHEAKEYTKTQKGKLRMIAFVDLLIAYAGSRRGQRKGLSGVLINLFLTALVEVWDLLSHYMLPAVVIEQKNLRDIIPELKALRNNVPATLVGVFGLDFAGKIVGTLLFPIYLIIIGAGVGIGKWFSDVLPAETVITIWGVTFSLLPVVVMLFFTILIASIIRRIVESTKVIYFTIFYTALTRPGQISPVMRSELTHYLLMNE